MALIDALKTIGNQIRKYTKKPDLIPLWEMPFAIDDVFKAGQEDEHSKMWDRLQMNGTLTNYQPDLLGYFNGKKFGFNNFYPKYDIRPVGNASYLFYGWENNKTIGVTDNKGSLSQRLEECGVVLDTSQATNILSMFAYSRFTEIPTIDCTGLNGESKLVFAYSYNLERIEKIITKEDVVYTNWFVNCSDLKSVVFQGEIGQNIDFSSCTKLTHDSLFYGIICHLKDYAGTGTTRTLTIGTENLAKLTDTEKVVATQRGWTLA